MAYLKRSMVESIFYRLALGATIVVLVFSILNGYEFIWIILRSALAFISIYYLGQILIMLWQKTSPPPQPKGQNSGKYFDILVGEDQVLHNQEKDITVKRSQGLPGQVRIDIKKDLPEDADTQAEMAKRMGWRGNQE